jgi:thioredoxin-like negative regulator of GroEL
VSAFASPLEVHSELPHRESGKSHSVDLVQKKENLESLPPQAVELSRKDSGKVNTTSPVTAHVELTEILSVADFANVISTKSKTVVIYWAPWCVDCKPVMDVVEKVANETPTVRFVRVNTEALEDVALEMAISKLPTVQFFKNGALQASLSGNSISVADIQKHLSVSK